MKKPPSFKKYVVDFNRKKFLSIIESLPRGTFLNVADAEILHIIGMAYDQQALLEHDESVKKDFQIQASKIARIIQKKWPTNPKGYRLLGLVLQHQGRSKEAVTFYKKAHKIDPDDTSIFLYLGNGYRANGQFSIAEAWYLKARAIENLKPLALLNLDALYEEMNSKGMKP